MRQWNAGDAVSLPIAAEIHYEGCHCADICTCDYIECIHEQCICDRLKRAYEHGKAEEREKAARRVRDATEVEDDCGVCELVRTRALAAVRGEDTSHA